MGDITRRACWEGRRIRCFIASAAFWLVPTHVDAQDAASCAASADLNQLITCSQKAEPQRAERCATPRSDGMVEPVEGKQILKFGQTTVYGGKSKGLVFQVGAELPCALRSAAWSFSLVSIGRTVT